MPDATNSSTGTIDPKSGFCSKTGIYHSLRPPVPLPPPSEPLSTTDFAFSLLNHHLSSSLPPPPTVAFLDAFTLRHFSFHDLILRTGNLISSLRHRLRLRKGDTVFVLSPNSLHIPILYFSLLSLGVVISPSNPASSESEILHQVRLSKPVTAFATSASLHKLPHSLKPSAIILDSPEFELLMTSWSRSQNQREKETEFERDTVFQSDPAAILYSSGTTGRVKGVILTHRNFISSISSALAVSTIRETPAVHLCTVPYFHVYGFVYCLRAAAMGETLVSFERFDLQVLLHAIQEFRVTHMAVAPPVVTRMIKSVGVVNGYDLSSLEVVACGGSALRNSVVEVFKEQFPNILLAQAYGLTESTARVFATSGPTECSVVGATGKLIPNCVAKIVDPETGISLAPAPNNRGELWVRGASIMKGYLGDEVATAATLDSEGWLRTGDICCINDEGFLFFVDRMKELIKCRGYQVAPAELEHLLQSHPDIDEAAVVPYPDDEAGQLPVAFVVRQTGSIISESHIKDFIAPLVAPYKRIHRVIFIDSLPRNAAGKVLRKELTKLATAGARSKL